MPFPAIINRSNPNGFSLIEVLIGLSLATFCLLAMGQLFYSSTVCTTLSRSKGSAILAARNKLEILSDLYSRNPLHADLTPGHHGPEEVSVINPRDNSILDHFRLTWIVGGVADPRPLKKTIAREVQVSVVPIHANGTLLRSPYFSGSIHLSTNLCPQVQ
jgi:prepilin-type N-terminal cleavage/methylation domain-containing protein